MNPPLLTLALLLAATPVAAADGKSSKAERLANTVVLNETAVKNLRLKIEAAAETDFDETLFALGRIKVLPGKRAVVSSRIAGRAVQVDALLDHEVEAGAPVAVIESRQAGDPPPRITLTAPISGIISEINLVPGEPVSPDKSLATILDLSRVYAIARVPEHWAEKLRRGLSATIRVPGWSGEVWEAKLEHLGALADSGSGTLEAAFNVNNEGLWLRPGMRAEFTIVVARRKEVFSVPRSALQGDPANRFLYVADEELPHAFLKVPVVTGAVNAQRVEITQGLLPGDKVVTEGAYSLAYAGKGNVSLKEALDAAHGHEHAADGGELPKGGAANAPAGEDGHDHGSASSRLSGLTLVSLIANGVLLVLLAVAAFRRPKSEDASVIPQPKPEGSGHA